MATLKSQRRSSPPRRRKFTSVDQMLRATGYRRVAAAVKALSAQTQLVDQLILARVAAGFTQAQLAARLKCSQSRISKLEDSRDVDLTIGDIQDYAGAVGLKLGARLSANRAREKTV